MILAMPLLEKILRGHVRTVPGKMHVKFEARSFNHFKLVCWTVPLHTDAHTDTHTSNENSISTIHSIHLAEITNCIQHACT